MKDLKTIPTPELLKTFYLLTVLLKNSSKDLPETVPVLSDMIEEVNAELTERYNLEQGRSMFAAAEAAQAQVGEGPYTEAMKAMREIYDEAVRAQAANHAIDLTDALRHIESTARKVLKIN